MKLELIHGRVNMSKNDVNGNLALNIDKSQHQESNETNKYSYQNLKNKLNISDNLDLFTICVLIGKFVVKKRKPLDKKYPYIKHATVSKSENFDILKALAIDEEDDIEILADTKAMYKIFEEYANTGFEELKTWYYDKDINFHVKISEVLLDFHENNGFNK